MHYQDIINIFPLLLTNFVSVSMILMLVYHNAYFNSTDDQYRLTTLFPILPGGVCAYYCYDNSRRVTGNFLGVNQTCILFSIQRWWSRLQLMNNTFTSVFSFPNRTTISCKSVSTHWMLILFANFILIRFGQSNGYNWMVVRR